MDKSYHSNPNWLYSGDMNAQYGGIWIRHHGDYCDAVEITDLDSACGFDGAVMIERLSSGLYDRKLSDRKKALKQALDCYGWTISDLPKGNRQATRAAIWEAMIRYGYCDRESENAEILQLDADGPMEFESWTAVRKQPHGDIGGYVMAKYLD